MTEKTLQERLKELINLPAFKARDKENQKTMLLELAVLLKLTPAERKLLGACAK